MTTQELLLELAECSFGNMFRHPALHTMPNMTRAQIYALCAICGKWGLPYWLPVDPEDESWYYLLLRETIMQ